MKRLLAVVFWSVIAAAFIGPGTVTACASAGASYGTALLWALVFSTAACLVLQEAAARVTVASGRTLGEALRPPERGGVGSAWIAGVALVAIVLGCAAYEAGNLLGAVAGTALLAELPQAPLALLLGGAAGALLWIGTTRTVVRAMSLLVAVMGVAFLVTAVAVRPVLGPLLTGAMMPSIPAGAGVLVLALVGTTVVPYNLFLGSGIATGQRLGEMRFGLTVAVGLGGVISMSIVVAGGAITGQFGFAELATVLTERVGPWARWLLAAGLFAAGFSSAITAPLAAAITSRDLVGGRTDTRWNERSWRWRAVWLTVLGFGVACAATGIRPIPAIILAQAANGLVLPVVALFLLLVVNDRSLMGDEGVNGIAANLATVPVCVVAVLLGTANLARAVAVSGGLGSPPEILLLVLSAVIAMALAVPIGRAVRRRRSRAT